MDDLGGSYRFTRIPSHVAVRYRFALVKVKRPSNSLILLVVCPALYCPLLPFTLLLFTAFYCPLPALYCPVLLFTAFYCPLPALYGPLLHFTALHCPLLPSTALYCMGQWLIKRSGRYRLGYRLGYRLPSHISHAKFRHKCRGCVKMSQQMIFVDRIAFGGVLSLSKEIGKIRHSTVTLLLTTITEVLTDAHIGPLRPKAAAPLRPSATQASV